MSLSTIQLLIAQAPPPAQVGRIEGGWGYVWAAYGITWGALFLYGIGLVIRRSARTDP